MILLALLALASPAAHQEAFEIGNITARPGEKISGRIEIPPSADDEGTFIPVTVVHGSRPGPMLALIAGVHGSEYAPILGLQRLAPLVDPAEVAGTVVIVHIANVPSFQGRTIYFGPVDRKNLNRSFPGNAGGSLTERIAHAIVNDVIVNADYVVDIHSGDANERLRPSYTGYYGEAGGTETIEKSKQMAVAFGLDTIVEFKGDLPSIDDAIWCGSAAVVRGIPAIDVESGELGLVEDHRIDPIVGGILSVMRHLEMLEGSPTPTSSPFFVRERAYVKSEHDGVWHPEPGIEAGRFVHEGALVGRITDYFGNRLVEARAPSSGMVLVILGTPPVNAGDTVMVIALVE